MADHLAQRLAQLEDRRQDQRWRKSAAMQASMTAAERLRQAEALYIHLRENLHG